VQVALPGGGLVDYTSKSQRVRIATEAWAESNLYCPNRNSPVLDPAAAGTPVIDFTCPKCAATYQLKSQSSAFARRIVDAAYSSMARASIEDRTPNLYALHYHLSEWTVENIILIPRVLGNREAKTARANGASRRMGGLQHSAARNPPRRKNQHRFE